MHCFVVEVVHSCLEDTLPVVRPVVVRMSCRTVDDHKVELIATWKLQVGFHMFV
jgi:hypothetical protein